MKLIVVTEPGFFVGEEKIITALFEEGLELLHLRKPNTPVADSERLLTLIPEKYHQRIITHDHFCLKEKFNLSGIHLNTRNPHKPADYNGHTSTSCHAVEEVSVQKANHRYVFLSPIFDSISKQDYKAAYTPEEIRKAVKQGIIDTNVMALGGINLDNIPKVKDYGFGGAVVLGDLWNRFNPCTDNSCLPVIEHFRKLKQMAD